MILFSILLTIRLFFELARSITIFSHSIIGDHILETHLDGMYVCTAENCFLRYFFIFVRTIPCSIFALWLWPNILDCLRSFASACEGNLTIDIFLQLVFIRADWQIDNENDGLSRTSSSCSLYSWIELLIVWNEKSLKNMVSLFFFFWFFDSCHPLSAF